MGVGLKGDPKSSLGIECELNAGDWLRMDATAGGIGDATPVASVVADGEDALIPNESSNAEVVVASFSFE